MKIEQVEYGLWIKRTSQPFGKKDFDLTLNFLQGFVDASEVIFRIFHSKGFNTNEWADPDADALIEKGKATLDEARRKEIYNQFQRLVEDRVPQLSIFTWDQVNVYQKHVKNYQPHPTSYYFGCKDVWLDK